MRAPTALDDKACTMSVLSDAQSRTDLLNRLKRAEGQLRGIQRMIEEGQECMAIATQMAAVRKALDSTYVRMTLCFVEQELRSRMPAKAAREEELEQVLTGMQDLLAKLR